MTVTAPPRLISWPAIAVASALKRLDLIGAFQNLDASFLIAAVPNAMSVVWTIWLGHATCQSLFGSDQNLALSELMCCSTITVMSRVILTSPCGQNLSERKLYMFAKVFAQT